MVPIMMLEKLMHLSKFTRFSLNSYKRSLSKNSVLFNDSNDDAIGAFLTEINSIKKSVKRSNNDLADSKRLSNDKPQNTEAIQYKVTESQENKDLSHNEQNDFKELMDNDQQDVKEPVYEKTLFNEKQKEYGDLLSELPASVTKRKLKLVSSKVYNDSVLKNMYGKTILSSAKEKKNKKESNMIIDEMNEYSSANSAEYWMGNTTRHYQENEKKEDSFDIKTSKASKKPSNATNDKDLINDEETKAKDKKNKKENKTKKKTVKVKNEPSETVGIIIKEDNAPINIAGTADNAGTVDTHDIISKPLNDHGVARQRNSILQIPFDREMRKTVPSVSKVLNISKSEESRLALEKWESRMILELGVQGFKEYKENMFRRGHAIHSLIERYLLHGEAMHIDSIEDEVTKNHVKSISHLLHRIKDVQALESAVIHPKLNYCGIVDCIARLGDDSICIIDWKTSEKAKPTINSLFDNPLQVVAYLGAINADPNYHHLGRIKQGAVVVIYNTGYSAVVHRFTIEQLRSFWFQWISRFKIFQERIQDDDNPATVAWLNRKK